MSNQIVAGFLAVMLFAAVAPGESPTTRRSVVIPPGFALINVGDRRVLCEPDDELWVRDALKDLSPATQPASMPTALLERLSAVRATLAPQITSDLALDDGSVVEAMFDEQLIPSLRRLEELESPIFYLATTRQKLKQLVRDGWQEPRFYYNRVADDVSIDTTLRLSAERDPDETVLPALYEPGESHEGRAESLRAVVREMERDLAEAVAQRGLQTVQLSFVRLIGDSAIIPLKLRQDQEWLGLGIMAVLSSKYASPVTGVGREELIGRLRMEHPRSAVKMRAIDLLHPTDPAVLRPEYLPRYVEAMRRKATAVVDGWTRKGGDEVIPRTLIALRKAPPADGAELVRMILETTGIELSAQVAGGR